VIPKINTLLPKEFSFSVVFFASPKRGEIKKNEIFFLSNQLVSFDSLIQPTSKEREREREQYSGNTPETTIVIVLLKCSSRFCERLAW